jgi:SH3-like domain-containing protein
MSVSKLAAVALCLLACPLKVASQQADDSSAEYAVVNVSVCNMRKEGRFTSGMETQALLGMPVKVLQFNGWYRIETPDNYTGWVHRMVIEPMTEERLREWNGAEKLVVTALYGTTHVRPDENSDNVSDVVAGDRLRLIGSRGKFYKAAYPDGREAYISKRLAKPEGEWRNGLTLTAGDILRTALSLNGIPYLWAGTSTKGMDCSGFVRTVFFMHDVILPRDAWQQAMTGERIEIAPDLSNLEPADLLFFGRKDGATEREAVSHVGIYIGGGRFIHSLGDVHVGSLMPSDSCYDNFNAERLLYGGRILPYINKVEEMNTTDRNPYYSK